MYTDDSTPDHWNPAANPSTQRLAERASAYSAWANTRSLQGLPSSTGHRMLSSPKPWSTVRETNGTIREGLNFLSSDYLGLSTHPYVKQAAISAIQRIGTHSAGSAVISGLSPIADTLAGQLGELLHQPYVSLHASGWAAGFDAMIALVRSEDAVLTDAHVCDGITRGACAATSSVYTYRHLDLNDARRWLQRLRERNLHQTLFVATSSIFPMEGASPDLTALVSLCQEYGASLLVDVAHDFGCVGAQGGGELEVQSLLSKVDIVVGSLSKTLASSGGFVATRRANLCDYIRARSPIHTASNALGPSQLASAHAALSLVKSAEGNARRAALRRAVFALRAGISENHLPVIGYPGPIVVIPVGLESVATEIMKLCGEQGVLVSLVESPLVPRAESRLRLRLMAGHEPCLMAEVATKIAACTHIAKRNDQQKILSDVIDSPS